jgi:hypothetical protein
VIEERLREHERIIAAGGARCNQTSLSKTAAHGRHCRRDRRLSSFVTVNSRHATRRSFIWRPRCELARLVRMERLRKTAPFASRF